MKEEKLRVLSKNICEYSIEVQQGDNVLIELTDMDHVLANFLIEDIVRLGGNPIVKTNQSKVWNSLYKNANDELWNLLLDEGLSIMRQIQGYISIQNVENAFGFTDIPQERILNARRILRPITDHRVNNTKWVVLRYPNASMAQSASMATQVFEDFYFDVCTMDYSKMEKAAQPLVELMQKTDRVLIQSGNGTCLDFSIKDIPAVACCGKRNIPDGEVFTAPIKDSINGTIYFNTPTVYNNENFSDIILNFRNGKIVDAFGSNASALNTILDSDDGARYIGEFALGFNPYITRPMCNILFDEKIAGSFHLTPGNCYDEADNKNKSSIHWDMVLIQTPEYGGGSIFFDDVLIRKDGLFVLPELEGLNPNNLK